MLYQFQNLSAFPEIIHGFFDREMDVRTDQEKIAEALKVPKIIRVLQVHGNKPVMITQEDAENNRFFSADALITKEKGVGILIQMADCQAILVYDPVKKVIANIHAGWRGLCSGIIENTIIMMQDLCGSKVQDLYIGISPSLGPCCSDFSDPFHEIPEKYHTFCRERIDRKWVNLWGITRKIFQDLGVDYEKQVEKISECTKCNKDFFSHRRGEKGRMGAVIMMK